MNKKHLYVLCGLLVLPGIAAALFSALLPEFSPAPDETTPTWRIETRLSKIGAYSGPLETIVDRVAFARENFTGRAISEAGNHTQPQEKIQWPAGR
jgi:hypothetical protein